MQGVQQKLKGKNMKAKQKKTDDELRPEYNFDYSKAVRGKYYKHLLEEGANIVVLEPDIAKIFCDSAAVNEALRALLELTNSTKHITSHSSRRQNR